MNFSIIKNIIGKILILLAALMVLPLIVSFIYQEGITYYLAYIIPFIVLIVLGILLNIKKAKSSKMLVREGMIIVGLSWLMMSLFGCIPFILTKDIPNFFDAFFEMASGFTTTGASIVPNVEVLSHSTLFWRSFSHWIGGMGVLVFILAIIPESKEGSSLHILRAESPGPQVGRLVSKMAASSRILYIIYMVLTLVEFLLLLLGPDTEMNVFHSLIYSLGTAGTGGFKMSRVVILFKSAVAKVKKLVRPRKVEVVYMDSKPLSEATVDSVMGYFVVYVLVFIVCTVLISIYNPNMPNIDLETTITSSLTCLNNVGPGLGSIVGPAGNFSSYSNFSKLVLTLEMIAGRLELFPILLLFSPNMWRKNN